MRPFMTIKDESYGPYIRGEGLTAADSKKGRTVRLRVTHGASHFGEGKMTLQTTSPLAAIPAVKRQLRSELPNYADVFAEDRE